MKDAGRHMKYLQKKVLKSMKQRSNEAEVQPLEINQGNPFKRPKPILNRRKSLRA